MRLISGVLIAVGCVANSMSVWAADSLDWPNWRGPQQNCSSTETNLPAEWDPKGGEGSNLLWKSEALGGRSTPIVMNGRLYTIVRHKPETELEAEKVVCADAATGDILWEHVFNVFNSEVPDTRVGWSCCVGDPETGNVYAQGVSGYFCCLDGETGKLQWDRVLHEEFGLLSTYGGRTNVPLVYADTVIVSGVVVGWGDTPPWGLQAKPAHRFLAFDKKSGEYRWLGSTNLIPYDTTYSTPTIARVDGRDMLIFGSGDGYIWALEAGTGRQVWSYALSRAGINVSPLVLEDGSVFVGHSEENTVGNTMGSVIKLDGKPDSDKLPISKNDQEKWFDYELMAGKSSPVMLDGRLYVVDDRAKLFVLDPDTGKQIAKKALGTAMRSTPLVADGKLYVCENGGRYYTLAPTEDGVEIMCKFRIPDGDSDGSPIVSHGRIYLPTAGALYCIGNDESIAANRGDESKINKFPWHSSTSQAAADSEPAHVQVTPYEVTLAPGQRQTFAVRLYDDHGRYIRDAKPGEATLAVTGPGNAGSGDELTYEADRSASHNAALLTASVGPLKGTGRVRLIPPLPWRFAFDDAADVPLSWVGGRIRYVVRGEGDKYIAKPTELPTRPGAPTTKLGTRSQMFMGSPKLADYTIAADVQLKVGDDSATENDADMPEVPPSIAVSTVKLPDIGVINSGYQLCLYGQSQELRMYSWCSHDRRTQKTIKMDLDPDKWYRLKLCVRPEAESGHCHVQGKIWVRGEAEPDEWTLEMIDESPQLAGSPGLYGNCKDAEALVDNIEVTPN